MSKYNKGIGAIVGGIIGIVMAAMGWTDAVGAVLPMFQPVQDALVTMIGGAIGAYIAPKNAE